MLRKPVASFLCEKAIPAVALCALFSALNLAAQNKNQSPRQSQNQNQVFKGAITDSMCAGPKGHAAMLKTGESLADCTLTCIKMGATFVLYNPQTKMVYQLDDQTMPRTYAARNVLVVGTVNKTTGAIHVSDIFPVLSAKVAQAKSVYIDCDNCVRGMEKANRAAVEFLADWKRFTLAQDPQKADLVFVFSANPYLGDYLRREGPDKRPVQIVNTYMNVIDPHTGASLWEGAGISGSWRVAGATKSLIGQFRARMEAEDGHVTRLLRQNQGPAPLGSGDAAIFK
jgi:hypothetical protein